MQTELSPDVTRELIQAARGQRKCDLVLRGGYVVNVFTGEIIRADVGIVNGYIAAVGSDSGEIEAERVIDVEDIFLTPGLIDAHMHLESSLLTPGEFARFVLPLGTTAVVVDPHEVANVAGTDGIEELMAASEKLPLTFYFMIPPAVPASDLETSGARLDASDIAGFADHPRVLGVAEAMDFPGVLDAREDVLEKIAALPGGVIDGHAPNLGGRDLQAYAAAGITSDHESTNPWEGYEKLRAGMYLMIREGSAARNLDDLIKLVDIHTVGRCLLVTDDLLPTDLRDRGHLNYLLSRSVRNGVSAAQAVRMATLNVAQRFKLDRTGAIAPGYVADIAAFDDLADFHASLVVANGEVVAMDGEMVVPIPGYRFRGEMTRSVHLPDLGPADLMIHAEDGLARIIEAMDGQILTRQLNLKPTVLSGHVVSDIDRDILKVVVVERHGKSGDVGLGLISGFGLKAGALASSVAHDSHNVVAVGVSDMDILLAIRHVGEMGGGLAAAAGGKIIAELPLPIYGLMSRLSAPVAAESLSNLEHAAKDLGCAMEHPLMTLSFMCLSVIPELKITDKGLVDANQHKIVPLYVEERAKPLRAAAG